MFEVAFHFNIRYLTIQNTAATFINIIIESCDSTRYQPKLYNYITTCYGIWTAHNWQKCKRVFLTCPCHEIYRYEAVDLKSCKYTLKITIYVNMWNLGQFREIWYFVNNWLIQVRI